MNKTQDKIRVYLEIGQKRTFAIAADWPGWCRNAKTEAQAIQAFHEIGPRYASIIKKIADISIPPSMDDYVIIEKVAGNATTDFGAPDIPLASDAEPVSADELQRWQEILQASWLAFDQALQKAAGKELQTGPRGGGRDLEKIAGHVQEAELSYLRMIGGKSPKSKELNTTQQKEKNREAIRSTLTAAVKGEIADTGPRGGKRWPPRYYIRRQVWHILEHVWEIEDRVL